jgi:hypothetical protein
MQTAGDVLVPCLLQVPNEWSGGFFFGMETGAGEGKTAVPVLEQRQLIAWFLAFDLALSTSGIGRAAHRDSAPSLAGGLYMVSGGVPCAVGAPFWAPPAATAADLPWPSVWLGHFSGGRPFINDYGQYLIDWRDERLCFALRRECQAWIRGMRRAYHRPEGFWTCLLLR